MSVRFSDHPIAMDRPVCLWFTIGGSGGPVEHRTVSWDLRKIGWAGFVDRYVRPAELLLRPHDIMLIHNPFGTLPTGPMQADQWIHARRAGLRWLTDGFADAWGPIAERRRVIAYFGTFLESTEFSELLRPRRTGDWLERILMSFRPALDAGVDIGFDASNETPESSPYYHLIRMVQSLLRKQSRGRPYMNDVWLEPLAHRRFPHLYNFNWVASQRWLEIGVTGAAGLREWIPPLDQAPGAGIIAQNIPPEGHTWNDQHVWKPGMIRWIHRLGLIPTVGLDFFFHRRKRIDELLLDD